MHKVWEELWTTFSYPPIFPTGYWVRGMDIHMIFSFLLSLFSGKLTLSPKTYIPTITTIYKGT